MSYVDGRAIGWIKPMVDKSLVCWKCGASLKEVPRPITRHSNCLSCYAELHCCVMCRRYDTRYPNRCNDERADPPVHKDSANFCEYFSPRPNAFDAGGKKASKRAQAQLKAMFGEGGDADKEDGPVADEPDDAPESEEESARRELEKLFRK